MSKRSFFEIHAFMLRMVFVEWKQMIEREGMENVPMLMGSFSTCMEKTKAEVHKILDLRIGDVNTLIYKLESRLNGIKKRQVLNKN